VARHGVVCRGPAPADVDIWADPHTLAAWTLGNLDSYWRRLLDRASRLPSRWGLATLTPYTAVWVVTGVSRLHHTLATGEITSKEGARRYALEAFPERWQRVVRESLRIRRADRARPGIAGAVSAQVQESASSSRRRGGFAVPDPTGP
jgi:aminoglycoside adenylyltransferase-like protein